jgi:hypothetical protein
MKINPLFGLFKYALMALLAAAALGCSVQGQITDLTQKTSVPLLSQAVGIVSGSKQNMQVNGYNVSVSIGDYTGSTMQQVVNNYTIYTSVQGALASSANEVQSH